MLLMSTPYRGVKIVMKQVLVLGSGLVAQPLVRHLLAKGHRVVIATLLLDRAAEMIAGHPNGKAFLLDVEDEARLASFIAACDVTVSLLPFSYHPRIASLCIAHRKHMVTTSYISPAMQELDARAREAGVAVLNEVGVDPGIDHMSAAHYRRHPAPRGPNRCLPVILRRSARPGGKR